MIICVGVVIVIAIAVLFKACHRPILSGNYNKVDIRVYGPFCDEVILDDKRNVDFFIEYVNKMYKSENLEWREVCKSPDAVIILTKNDGTEKEMYIYGPCLHYEDKQYDFNGNQFYDYIKDTWLKE